ncbi:CDP-alcohol phosphatidyltransferase family protein [Akkermansiaceae bacterium]|nr:CDP-alcohol phosphatidyltransferase family protein [Akkermansiaceae bacterium]MDB4286724.1 CDP-alcohol phosphatidyltransferase family protein [bacterium]MDA8975819.1 CDP-alcohol phosphatidyltransferase family protein [Akkermansiaceae bacterium]MDB4271798.1 CDP-alcohol phosphatidyltransferase family protein [Akkermansiaceae bacterium]MDB4412251.1 CDP-alcohol phosphatidyltransferase family protein [Akkermansiaceae bacterium]
MTYATLITLLRLFMVPVFCVLAIRYGDSVAAGDPNEKVRWFAVITYITAAALDGLDGWVARRFDQKSLMGSILDPLTDKALLLTGLITLTLVDWGQDWHLPMWFLILVILRDTEIIVGIWILYLINRRVPIRPHWSGKVCTVTQMIALGWVMLKLFDLSPIYPVAIATVFTLWSGVEYFREGLRQLREIKRPGR